MARSIVDVAREVRDTADIVAVIGRYVSLKKAGATYKACCPFHQEKTPSFTVNPGRNSFKCFGCGEFGSVIDFVMKVERVEFREATEALARELGIAPPDSHGTAVAPEEAERKDRRKRDLRRANEFARDWFRRTLSGPAGQGARAYIEKRGLSHEVVERFHLGASPDEWTALLDAARREGFSDDLLVRGGLAKRAESGRVYDAYRNRLVFPINDHLGRSIGFGGRRLDDSDDRSPKYINSEETELYRKSESLYGLDAATEGIRQRGFALLTEGYLDAVVAHQFGLSNAVATLGTALTPKQARLLRRFTQRVVFMYDGDTAGQKAMLAGGEALFAAGLDVRVVSLPPDDDPDTFLQREGLEAAEAVIGNAREYFDFALDRFALHTDPATIAGKAELVQKVAPLILSVTSEVAREAAVSRLLERLGQIPREAVDKLLAVEKQRQSRRSTGDVDPDAGRAVQPTQLDPLDRVVLRLMFESPASLAVIRSHLDETWLQDRRLEGWILHFAASDHPPQVELANLELERAAAGGDARDEPLPGEPSFLYAVISADAVPCNDPERAAEQILSRLLARHQKQVVHHLLEDLRTLSEGNDGRDPSGLMQLLMREAQRLASLRIPTGRTGF